MMCRSSRAAAAGAAGSAEPRMVSAASLSPAAQPSVRSTSASTAPEPTSTWLTAATRPAASVALNRRSAARISVSSPRALIRASGSGGSNRAAITSRSDGGR